jgi:hypothetical protein
MPSLLRFLGFIGAVVGAIYLGMYALANFYHPKPREITLTVPAVLSKQR